MSDARLENLLSAKAVEVLVMALRLAPELERGEALELGDMGLDVTDVANIRRAAQALRSAADRMSASVAAFALDEFGAGEMRLGEMLVSVSETTGGDWKPIPEMIPHFAEFLRTLSDEELVSVVAKWRVTPLGAGKDTFLHKEVRVRPEVTVSAIESLPPRMAERAERLPDRQWQPRR